MTDRGENSLLAKITKMLMIDWPASEQEVPPGSEGVAGAAAAHLWDDSWDDDDSNEDFSKQLKAELERVKAAK